MRVSFSSDPFKPCSHGPHPPAFGHATARTIRFLSEVRDSIEPRRGRDSQGGRGTMAPVRYRWLPPLLVLTLSACRCGGGGPPTTTSGGDEALIQAIRAAAIREADPDSISRLVNARPTLNTARPAHRARLEAIDFAPDPDRRDEGPPPSRWRQARDVVYWVRPGRWTTPRIVGVAWLGQGPPEVFFAEVLPPREGVIRSR